jgi:uncharacterized protein
MDDPEAAVAELEYATKEMGALGAQIYTHVHGRPMDDASFDPFYATAARLGSYIRATIKTSRKSACPRRKSRRSSAVTSSASPGSR